MTPAQSRAARALLDWSPLELAMRARLEESRIRDFEAGRARLSEQEAAAIGATVEGAGVEFTGDGEGGVRMKPEVADEGLRPDELTSQNDT